MAEIDFLLGLARAPLLIGERYCAIEYGKKWFEIVSKRPVL